MTDELYKEIDLIISDLVKNGLVVSTSDTSEIFDRAIVFLKSKGFIKQGDKAFKYEPNSETFEIHKIGIKEYLKDTNFIKELELKIKELTVKNLELQNKQMKRTVLYSIIGFLAGAIVTNLKDILILLNIMTPE